MFIGEPTTQIELGKVELSCFSSPAEGVGPFSIHLSLIPSTLCPVRVVLCLAANQICNKWLMYIPEAGCLSSLDTWPEPSVMPQLDPGGTLKHQLTCPIVTHLPQACFIPSLFHFSTYSVTQLFSSYIYSQLVFNTTLSGSTPEGFVLHSTCSDSYMNRSMVSD